MGISYRHKTRRCVFKSVLMPKKNNGDYDSAVLVPNDTHRDCPSLGEEVKENGTNFKNYCGSDYLYDDFGDSYHAKSLKDCMRICVEQGKGCGAVSYNADMSISQGYWNCYPKRAANTRNLNETDGKVDTAVVVFLPAEANPSMSTPDVAVVSSEAALPPINTTQATNIPIVGNTPRENIAVIAIGSLIGLLILAAFVLFSYRRYRTNMQNQEYLAELAGKEIESITTNPVYQRGATNSNNHVNVPSELESESKPAELA